MAQIIEGMESILTYIVEKTGDCYVFFRLFGHVKLPCDFTRKAAHINTVCNFLCEIIIYDSTHSFPR